MQENVEKIATEAKQLQSCVTGKEAALLLIQSELAKLQLERMDNSAKMGALSESVDDARMEAQAVILRAAAKEDDLEKSKNLLTVVEADLLAYKRRLVVVEEQKSQLQDRLGTLSGECDALKDSNMSLKSEIEILQSKQATCKALESQLRSDLANEQNRADELAQECVFKTSMLDRKAVELGRLAAKLKVAEDRLEKAHGKLQDAGLQIANIQVLVPLNAVFKFMPVYASSSMTIP